MTEAIMLVGGMGTRLRPLTLTTPKPMLPVAGVPFIAHQLAQARAAGITRVVLATSYRAEVFDSWLGDGTRLGLEIECVVEDVALGTGGAIRNAVSSLGSGPDDPVVVFNGDVLSGHDIASQISTHLDRAADITLYLTEVEDARAFGCVPTDVDGFVTAFLEKMPVPVTNRINAGCYVFRRRVIDEIPTGRVVSVERETFPSLLEDGRSLIGYVDNAYWLDLGSPEALVRGSRDLVLGAVTSPAVPAHAGDAVLLDGATVGDDARVFGGSTLGARSRVETGASVDGSIVQDDVTIGSGAHISDSVIGRGAVIGSRTRLDGVVIGEGAVIGTDCELARGARVWADVHLPDMAVRWSSDLT